MFDTKTTAAGLSIFSNVSLVLLKLVVGAFTGSISIISEAVHSGIDLLASVMTFFSVRVSDRPPDSEHPYGHGKIENITSLVEALLIVVAAVYIIYEAVHRVKTVTSLQAVPLGLGVMFLSAGVNFLVTRKLFFVARSAESAALEADAHHLRLDIYTSLGVLVGLGFTHVFKMPVLDPILAILIAMFITKIAWNITKSSLGSIVDQSLPEEELVTIRSIIKGADERIKGFHRLRTRKAGAHRHVDLHIQVDKNLTVCESHIIANQLEEAICNSLPRCRVVVHIEPEKEKHTEMPASIR
ncbi:MAG: cation transporter [Deltaproteobacteria bacterium]|nr:cation transporter [Deltaproteobacteria bacterium]MBW2306174.1 cation transporter [Deltaproteobacteria bacterium]